MRLPAEFVVATFQFKTGLFFTYERRARMNCIAHLLKTIPYKKVSRDRVRLPKRSDKGRYTTKAPRGIKFAAEQYCAKIGSRSLERDRHSTYRGRKLDADLAAGELQDHALFILQLYAPGSSCHRTTGADRGVSTLDIGRDVTQVQGAPSQLGGGGADREAHAHPRRHEPVVSAATGQYAVATADAHNESALGEDDADRAGLGSRWRNEAECQ